ncbi:coth protein-domain-containing protein [Parasitella parasitica]|nr:coth protein-domain-containing protein [Parasitella parasitica]
MTAVYSNSIVHAQATQNYDVSTTTFSVIHSPNFYPNRTSNRPDNKMGVRLEGNDKIYLLDNANSTDSLLYTGIADVPLLFTRYKYVVVNSRNKEVDSEPFYRDLEQHKNGAFTPYEFYGRHRAQIQQYISRKQQHTLPQVKWTYKDAQKEHRYSEGLDRGQVHPVNDIPTWHIQANPADFGTLTENILQDVGITANVTRVSSSHIEQFRNVKIELSGQTSRLFKKLSYSVHIDKEGSINGYRRFKLRSCATDPSYMREKLFYDILDASKLPTAKASYIRLFINQEPQGLYLVVDNYKNPFLRNVLGNGKSSYKHGALFQGSMQENPLAVGKLQSGANLGYLGPSSNDYIESSVNLSSYKVQEIAHGDKSKDNLASLVSFIKFIQETSKRKHARKRGEKKLTDEWNKRFDVSLFLKHIVFEVLLGHGDGYMGAAHNYMLYQDLEQHGRFVWLASDLDQTMGSTLKANRSTPAHSAFQQLDRFGLFSQTANRPLVNQLFQIKPFADRFYQIFSDVNHSLFKSNAITDHIIYLQNLIEQDVEWDQHLDAYRPDNFIKNKHVYDDQLNQKVLQLPLGRDFIDRISSKSIGFRAAIEGPITGHPSITSLFAWFTDASQYLDKFSARIIAQIVVSLGSVVTRAFVAAYKQAAANAGKNGGAQAASGGRAGTREGVVDALTRKTGMSMEEACQILNITKEADLTKLSKNYDHLFSANDPAKGGSFYIQSKVVRAKERFDMEKASELKTKATEEAAAAAAKAAESQQPPPPPPNA